MVLPFAAAGVVFADWDVAAEVHLLEEVVHHMVVSVVVADHIDSA